MAGDSHVTPLSKCGSVRLEFRFEARRKRLGVVVREALDLPSQDRGGYELTEAHLVLLPAKRTRHKTHAKPGSNPTFDDNFHFRVPAGQSTDSPYLITQSRGEFFIVSYVIKITERSIEMLTAEESAEQKSSRPMPE